MNKHIKTSIIIIALLIIVIATWWFVKQSNKNTVYTDTEDTKPWGLIGGEGERIYLDYGVIYADIESPDKEYNIVNYVVHVTAERYKKLIFFDTPEEAEKAGYKPSEDFAKEYTCFNEGKDTMECSGVFD